MEAFCDLHTHSTFSDGSYTPAELVAAAMRTGLSAVALTDHNTLCGLPHFLEAAKGANLEAIPGVEISVDYEGTELHLLGLYLPETAFAPLGKLLEEQYQLKEESNLRLVASLQNAGFDIDYRVIQSKSPDGTINRANIARELTEKGYTESIDQAMKTLLAKNGEHYVQPQRITVWEALKQLKALGAVSVLAHPLLNLTLAELTAFLPEAKKLGLAGFECYYSTYSQEETEASLALAEALGLKKSGGSDFHGDNKPHIPLGVPAVPYACAQSLKAALL